jgi:hypothetical protein
MFKTESTSQVGNLRVNTNTPRKSIRFALRNSFVYSSISNGVTILGPGDTTGFARESYVGQGLR